MGGCLQTRRSWKAKKRNLLLIIARVLRFIQLGVAGACWVLSRLGIFGRAPLLKRDFCVLLCGPRGMLLLQGCVAVSRRVMVPPMYRAQTCFVI